MVGMRILVVDDSKMQRWALQKILEKAGYATMIAADGQTALDLTRRDAPDLILLDMILPRLDGTAVLGELKNDPKTTDIPVIALTGLSQKNESRLMESGAAGFYHKPESGIEEGTGSLLELIHTVLTEKRWSERQRQLANAAR